LFTIATYIFDSPKTALTSTEHCQVEFTGQL